MKIDSLKNKKYHKNKRYFNSERLDYSKEYINNKE